VQHQSHFDVLDGMLQHVPAMDLEYDGVCAQPVGVDLPIVVINLPRRSDRWEALSRRMSALGLTKLIKAPAVEGSRLSDGQIGALLRGSSHGIDEAPRSHLTLTRPAIGCFLSHLAIWRWMITNNLPRVLIFEDDAAPAPHFDPARFRTVLASIPQDAGMVFLGRIIMNGLADRPVGSVFARIYYFNGTFAYLITPAGCRALIRYLLPPHWHIDHQISKVLFERRHVFPAYYTEPHFFEPDWSLRSDCYVPLAEESDADRELGRILQMRRRHLLDEGRPLLSAMA
jgi:GR25 family glycosyltransferase involved in LPS biosynthesis